MPVQRTGSQVVTSWSTKFTWKITNFTELSADEYRSRPFTIGNSSWEMVLYPKGDGEPGYLSLYLAVANSASLPHGKSVSVNFSLTVVNQRNANSSLKREDNDYFRGKSWISGFARMISLYEVINHGFLVNNTLIIQADFGLLEAAVEERPVESSTEMFDSYFSSLERYISLVDDVPLCCGTLPCDARSLTLDEVEEAKRNLKECLSDLFKLNMKDRLAEALSTLSRAEVGLSAGQSSSVRAFWTNFGDFTSDFLTFEQGNVEFELQNLLKDQMLSEMKKCHEKHIVFKKSSEELAKGMEEWERKMEECERKIEEIRRRREKLESDWEILLAESQEAEAKHEEHEMKAKEAEEKKRVAEERMSRSTKAWFNLKAEFA